MMSGLAVVFGLIVFAATLGLFGVLIRLLIASVTLPRRMAAEAACDRCKYPIAGLAGWTCPECGADLRVVGVVTPTLEMKRRGTSSDAIAAWTLLILIVGGYAGTIVSTQISMSGTGNADYGSLAVIVVLALVWAAGVAGIVLRRRALQRRFGVSAADLRRWPMRG